LGSADNHPPLLLLLLLLCSCPQDAVNFDVNFVTVVPFFKVAERVPFTGAVKLPRRDLRSGKQTAAVERTPGGVKVTMKWHAPFAGEWGIPGGPASSCRTCRGLSARWATGHPDDHICCYLCIGAVTNHGAVWCRRSVSLYLFGAFTAVVADIIDVDTGVFHCGCCDATGGLVEDYEVREDGSLLVTGVTTIGDASVTARQVYRRSSLSRDAFLKDSQKKNGNLGDVMRRHAEEDRKRK
jgi:hypothetical protein